MYNNDIFFDLSLTNYIKVCNIRADFIAIICKSFIHEITLTHPK